MTVERYDPPAAGQHLALVNPVTDSWTAVLMDVVKLAENISNTEFVPAGLRGSTPKTVAAILHGRELGLPPMTALAHTSVINGRPGTSAEVMRALILQAGHDLHIETSDARRCTIRGRRADWAEDRWTTVTFSIEDAARAGLLEDKRSKDGRVTPSMYKKWPAALLLARASTILARMVFADVIHGMRSVEELQDMTEPGEWVEPAAPVTAQVSRRASGQAPRDPEPRAVEGPPAGGEGPVAAESEQPAAAATGRKRAALTKRGNPAPPPAPAPAAEPPAFEAPATEADDGDPAATAADPTSVDDVKAALRKRSIASVQMHFERLLGQPVNRQERLDWTAVIVGHPVESTNDLSVDEIRKVLGRLERFRSRDQLELALGGREAE